MVSYISDRQRRILTVPVLLLLIAPTGNAIISQTVNGYLFTIPDPPDSTLLTREGAQKWCMGNNSTLAEISNSQIQQAIVLFINGKSQTGLGFRNIWVNGMRTPMTSWMWVNEKNTDGISSLPQTNSENVNGYLKNNQNGPIFADQPTAKKGYICEGSALCGIGGFQYSGRCYRDISTQPLPWYDARNECVNRGGDIASFDFIRDDQSLKSFNWSWIDSSTEYWIGIRKRWWTWQSSKYEIMYTNWDTGHPTSSSDCLQLVRGDQWKWGACGCNEEQQLICLRDTASTSAAGTLTKGYGPTSLQSKSTLDYLMTTLSSSSTTDSKPSGPNAVALGVGLGVGIGGLLIIIAVIVIVILRMKRRRNRQLQTPDILVTPENNYAKILGNSMKEMDVNEANTDANKIVYSTVHITNPSG